MRRWPIRWRRPPPRPRTPAAGSRASTPRPWASRWDGHGPDRAVVSLERSQYQGRLDGSGGRQLPGRRGTLNGWSIIVTPRAFTCSAFTDTTPPTTTVSLTPPAPNGGGGWYVSPVTVAVSADDGGGTVAETRCALDPAVPPTTFAQLPAGCPYAGAGSSVATQGQHTVLCSQHRCGRKRGRARECIVPYRQHGTDRDRVAQPADAERRRWLVHVARHRCRFGR